MSNEVQIVTRKDIIALANKTIDSCVGKFKRESVTQSVVDEVNKQNVTFLLDEVISQYVSHVFNSRSKPKGKKNGQGEFDWGAYAKQLIKLENGEGVLMRYAERDHLIERRQNISDNAIKIGAAAYEDTQRIDKLVKAIEKNGLANAGDAMRHLGYDIDTKTSVVDSDVDVSDEDNDNDSN